MSSKIYDALLVKQRYYLDGSDADFEVDIRDKL
jgi:hypothetical protein